MKIAINMIMMMTMVMIMSMMITDVPRIKERRHVKRNGRRNDINVCRKILISIEMSSFNFVDHSLLQKRTISKTVSIFSLRKDDGNARIELGPTERAVASHWTA
jgi:hypothetical protein